MSSGQTKWTIGIIQSCSNKPLPPSFSPATTMPSNRLPSYLLLGCGVRELGKEAATPPFPPTLEQQASFDPFTCSSADDVCAANCVQVCMQFAGARSTRSWQQGRRRPTPPTPQCIARDPQERRPRDFPETFRRCVTPPGRSLSLDPNPAPHSC